MKNVLIVSRDKSLLKESRKVVIDAGFTLVKKSPDLIICIGGDGTLLRAERLYPSIPKLLVRGSDTCQKCGWETITDVVNDLRKKRFKIENKNKIEVTIGGNKLIGLNDVALRNKFTTHAIRFRVKINNKLLDNGRVFIGDGLVLATSYGSTGYFHSITRKNFSSGLGLAFNNITVHHPELYLKENDKIEIELMRGTGIVVADNNPKTYEIKPGAKIVIRKSKELTKILKPK